MLQGRMFQAAERGCHDLVKVEFCEVEFLTSGKGLKLIGQFDATAGRLDNVADDLSAAALMIKAVFQQGEIAADRREDVVELVRDRRGKLHQRLDFLLVLHESVPPTRGAIAHADADCLLPEGYSDYTKVWGLAETGFHRFHGCFGPAFDSHFPENAAQV